MASRQMWMGPRGRERWVPAPQTGMDISPVGWVAQSSYLNGGTGIRSSFASHREYQPTWNPNSRDALRPVMDMAMGLHGTGLIYFIDPAAADKNVLPVQWSWPALAAEDGPVLFGDERPATVPTPFSELDYPALSASYSASPGLPATTYSWNGIAHASTSKATNLDGSTLTNLLTNPSMESNGAVGVSRTNFAHDGRRNALGGTTMVADQTIGNRTWHALTAGPNGASSALRYDLNGLGIASGVAIAFGVLLRNPGTANLSVEVDVGDDVTKASVVVIAPNQEVRVTAWGTPAADNVYQFADISPLTDGALLLYSEAIAETGTSQVGAFFDGGSTPANDFYYAWNGTANASPSTQRYVGVMTASSGNGIVLQSTKWAKEGTYSARFIPTAANTDSYIALHGDIGSNQLGLVAGQTYTFIASGHLEAPLTGNRLGNTPQLQVIMKLSDGSYRPFLSDPAPNVAGDFTLRLTFTAPANALGGTEATVRLYSGAALGGGDIWWDSTTFVVGKYTGAAFNGGSAALPGVAVPPATRSKLYVPIPRGHTAWVGWHGDANGTGGIEVTPILPGNTAVDPVLPEPLDATDSTRVTDAFPGDTYQGIELRFGGGSATSVTISGVMVQILKSTATPQAGPFVSGQGHSGCKFNGKPTHQVISAAVARDGLVQMSAKLVEIGDWL